MAKDNVPSPTSLKRLIVIGPGHSEVFLENLYIKDTAQEIFLEVGDAPISIQKVQLKNGEEAYCIGDGRTPISLAKLNTVMKYIGEGGRIDFCGHGNHSRIFGNTDKKPYDRTHSITIVAETKVTQEVSASALQSKATEVHFWSCYGGTDRKKFLRSAAPNTTIYLHAGAAHPTFFDETASDILTSYDTAQDEGKIFPLLQNYIRSSPETINVIHKISETQAVWMHFPFPKPDNPNHIDAFLYNHIEQNMIAAEQLERIINPSYTPKTYPPVQKEELKKYRNMVLDIATSRGLTDTVVTFLHSPEFNHLPQREKDFQFADLLNDAALFGKVSTLQTLLKMRPELGLEHVSDDKLLQDIVVQIQSDITTENPLLFQKVELLNTYIAAGIFADDTTSLPLKALLGNSLFSDALNKPDNPICNLLIDVLINIGAGEALTFTEHDTAFVLKSWMENNPPKFISLLENGFLSEHTSDSIVLDEIMNNPALVAPMIEYPKLAQSCAKMVYNAFQREGKSIPRISNRTLASAISRLMLPKGIPVIEGTADLQEEMTTGSGLASSSQPNEANPLPRGIRPPGRRIAASSTPVIPVRTPRLMIQSICRVKDILKAMPDALEKYNLEYESSITFDQDAFTKKLCEIVYNEGRPLGSSSIKQSVVSEHGTVKPEYIEAALQEACKIDATASTNLMEKCSIAIKAIQQRG